LEHCPRLEILDLAMNELKEIDLSVLSNCVDLSAVSLSHNQLTTIDLSPLEKCVRLQRLHLKSNPLAQVDISPLFVLPELESLLLDQSVVLIAHPKFKQVRFMSPSLKVLIERGQIKWEK
jgi:Leucine-rich repeat (LRR) protein